MILEKHDRITTLFKISAFKLTTYFGKFTL